VIERRHHHDAARDLLAELRRHKFATDEKYIAIIVSWLDGWDWGQRTPSPDIGAEERRIADIEGELAASLSHAEPSNASNVSFAWETVEFLVRMVRRRDARIGRLLRHVTAALKQLTYPRNTKMLDGHPAVIDARRLLSEVADLVLLDGTIAESGAIMARAKMDAYRQGLAATLRDLDTAKP
jgi:hypothetical protein